MTEIHEDTPAADSGINRATFCCKSGKTKVHQPEDVIDASFFITAGDTVPITVMRGDEKLTFKVQAGFHPASHHPPVMAFGPSMNQAMPLRPRSHACRTPQRDRHCRTSTPPCRPD